VFIRSISFNCRYSAFRNLSFRFDGKYLEAFKILSACGLIPVYLVGGFFNFWGSNWVAGLLAFGFVVYYPWWMRNIKEFTVTHTSYGGQYGRFSVTGGTFFRIYFVSGLFVLLFAIVSGILISVGAISLSGNRYFIYIFSAPIYLGYIFAYAYMRANITNTVWKNIGIGPVFFESNLRTIDLLKLYLTNAAGIIASAGLLIPWAVIRTFRYRVEHTKVFHSGSLTSFVGEQDTSVAATGAELIDFFDLDVSL
jgi:uncharacterized membrane protein YjgN (DUF898 family)